MSFVAFFWHFFIEIGWLLISLIALWGIYSIWLLRREEQFASKREWTLLAIDIPSGNERAPEAVENMFTQLSGAHSSIGLLDKYWFGKSQTKMSFEIISIGGYIQFLVYCEKQFRDFVESVIYAQYPEAEITEIEDYTKNAPNRFPNDEWDMWATELFLDKSDVYPIKTYKEFLDASKHEFKDPMAALLEALGNIKQDEQIWLQFIVSFTGREIEEKGAREISKIIGEKIVSENIIDKIIKWILDIFDKIGEAIIQLWKEEKEQSSADFKMLNLKPIQKMQIEAIQNKVSKFGLTTKIRFTYISKKGMLSMPRGVSSVIGAIKQFTNTSLNSLRPETDIIATNARYFLTKSRLNKRKNRLLKAAQNRDNWTGKLPFILNPEELATLWHFPIELEVEAPLLERIPAKKTGAPVNLPIGGASEEEALPSLGLKNKSNDENKEISKQVDVSPPNNLPLE